MPLNHAKKREYFNLPNYLTLSRILLIPVVMALIAAIEPGRGQALGYWAAFVFTVAGVSDVVDGHYARKYQINSVFGKYFDPLADKLMILSVMIMLIPLQRIAAWMVVVFLSREIAITALRGIASSEGIVLPADQWGKKKTLLQHIALVAILIYYPLWGVNPHRFGEVVLWLALLMAIFSGVHYVRQFIRQISEHNATP